MSKFIQLDDSSYTLAKRLWRDYMRAHKGKLTLALICMAIVGLATGGSVKLLEPTLDQIFINKDADLIWWIAGAYVVALFARGAANFGQTVLLQRMGLQVIEALQNHMFGAIQDADLLYLQNQGTAKQLSRFFNDVTLMRATVAKVFTSLGRDLSTIIVLVGVMFYTNWQLSLAAFIFFPVSIYPIVRIGKRMRKVSTSTQQELGEMSAVLDDALKNLKQTRAYNRQDHEKQRASRSFSKAIALQIKAIRTRSLSHPILDTLSGVVTAMVILWGGHMILADNLTVGQFMTFFVAVIAAYQPMRSIASLNSSLQEGLAAAHRVFGVIDMEPTIKDAPGAREITPGPGAISLKDVAFSYDEDNAVLRTLSLDVPAGKKVALVGPSGGGKSTILNLIPRFYDVTGGALLIDGQDIRDVTLTSLRSEIGLVSQESTLFNDTIRGNIAYGKPDATEDEIVDAAKAAAAHEFILGLPDGYDTKVGELGLKLSGGQRQRISIARAMLKNAPILLLDEATSALDTESERQVQAALERLMEGRTSVVIAHRLSTINDADLIFVLDQGQVVESGTHQSLLQNSGLYAKLCSMQFQDEGMQGTGQATAAAEA